MSLLRANLLQLATIGVHVTMTPPTERAPAKERVRPRGMEHLTAIHYFLRASFWISATAELVCAWASTYPSHPFSVPILTLLSFFPGVLRDIFTHKRTITPLFLVGCLLSITGGLVRIFCYRTLGHQFTFDLSIRPQHKLITSGPYGIVRHPSYTGALSVVVGMGMCYLFEGGLVWAASNVSSLGNALWWVSIMLFVVMGAFVERRMEREDRLLEDEFGDEWRTWKRRVPWRLVPGLY